MDIKMREAIANVAKQPPNPNLKKPDPLSLICAQRKKNKHKRKIIQKKSTNSLISHNQTKRREIQRTENKDQLRSQKRRKILEDHKQQLNKMSIEWLKYLPNQRDQFEQLENLARKDDGQKVKIQSNPEQNLNNTKQVIQGQLLSTLLRLNSKNQQQCKNHSNLANQIDYQKLKQQLGLGKKEQQVKVKIQEKTEVPLKKESPNAALLPFPGRDFQQAPPRPAPKMIWEYPPTDKVAGIYPWPPPQSDYRKWKNQMRQSRKLN